MVTIDSETLVNETLAPRPRATAAFSTRAVASETPTADLGRYLADNLDDLAGMLAVAEGEDSGDPRRHGSAGQTS